MKRILLLSFCLFMCVTASEAQRKNKAQKPESETLDMPNVPTPPDSIFAPGLKWRNIGPTRGGRSTAVCGVIQDPFTFYFGSTGGGVWKTTDGGAHWKNISDGYFKTGSVGAISVAPSDPNVIYVGMGEAAIRGVMTSHGDGVYKSTDAGETWTHIGLEKTRQISKIRVHPSDPDLVYVGAQGSPHAPTEDRGVFRSTDGGTSWTKVHFVDENSGVSDLSMDLKNPRNLYAAYWDHQRLPWKVRSGGPGSSIWKSTNGGDDWTKLTGGLPDSIMGKIGVVASPAQAGRVYAIIESDQGGLYRSDDGGKKWTLLNTQRILRTRSWYYMHIFAHPQDADHVVVLNAPYMESLDGGKTFTQRRTPHGDNHDLWFHPDNPMIMVQANDGGANVSYNGGRTWSTQQNQPTAQFYRVNADNQFPYHVYGGQQDNSSIAVPSQSSGSGIPYNQFYSVGGCESAYNAFDPDDPRYVYSGCYQGIIQEYDHKLKLRKDIMAYPDLGLGQRPLDMKYRFNWNAPIIMSEHDRSVLYHAGNVVLKSTDRGISWTEISGDLTRNRPDRLDWGGGPITNEGAGGENYQTIMYLEESPLDAQVLWAGTDDGLIHVTRDGGKNWDNVTPPNLPEGMVNSIDASRHKEGKVYVAFTRYKFNDFTPHVYITTDFGKTWNRKVRGIGEEAHVRVVREDPTTAGLLYAGTETGLYLSYNDGRLWQPFQLNLPIVPITDLKVHHGDLIAATQGRAFWILDDLTAVRNWDEGKATSATLFEPTVSYLWGGGQSRGGSRPDMGQNPDYGTVAFVHLPEGDSDVSVQILEDGEMIKAYSTKAKDKSKQIKVQKGLNKIVWNHRPDGEEAIKGVMTLGGNQPAKVGPGMYEMLTIVGDDTLRTAFEVAEDPRLEVSPEKIAEKYALIEELEGAAKDLTETVKRIDLVRGQIKDFNTRDAVKADSALSTKGKEILMELDSLESQLVQRKQKTFQDVINFPNQLDAKIRHIQGLIQQSYPPVTMGQKMRSDDVLGEWAEHKTHWNKILGTVIKAYNAEIQGKSIPFINTELPGKKPIKP
ncbi:MAG: glycosyl hydrolase [Saprospiraceae bacterium]|nr:glycosyl hydrolase [Saprospiraceae bacterium]